MTITSTSKNVLSICLLRVTLQGQMCHAIKVNKSISLATSMMISPNVPQ